MRFYIEFHYCGLLPAQAQERVEALRVAFITDRLALTPTEAQQFFDRLFTPPTEARADLYAALIDGLVADGGLTLRT